MSNQAQHNAMDSCSAEAEGGTRREAQQAPAPAAPTPAAGAGIPSVPPPILPTNSADIAASPGQPQALQPVGIPAGIPTSAAVLSALPLGDRFNQLIEQASREHVEKVERTLHVMLMFPVLKASYALNGNKLDECWMTLGSTRFQFPGLVPLNHGPRHHMPWCDLIRAKCKLEDGTVREFGTLAFPSMDWSSMTDDEVGTNCSSWYTKGVPRWTDHVRGEARQIMTWHGEAHWSIEQSVLQLVVQESSDIPALIQKAVELKAFGTGQITLGHNAMCRIKRTAARKARGKLRVRAAKGARGFEPWLTGSETSSDAGSDSGSDAGSDDGSEPGETTETMEAQMGPKADVDQGSPDPGGTTALSRTQTRKIQARRAKLAARKAELLEKMAALKAQWAELRDKVAALDEEDAQLAAQLAVPINAMEVSPGEEQEEGGQQAASASLVNAAADVFALPARELAVQEELMWGLDEAPSPKEVGQVRALWQLRVALQRVVDDIPGADLDPPARHAISRLLTEAGSGSVTNPEEGPRTLGRHVTRLLLRAAQTCLAQDVSRDAAGQHAEVFARQLLELHKAVQYDAESLGLVSRAISDLIAQFCYEARRGTPAADGCVLPDALAEELLTCIKNEHDQAVAAATREMQTQGQDWDRAHQAAARTALEAMKAFAHAASEELEAWRARSAPPGNDDAAMMMQVDDDMPAGDGSSSPARGMSARSDPPSPSIGSLLLATLDGNGDDDAQAWRAEAQARSAPPGNDDAAMRMQVDDDVPAGDGSSSPARGMSAWSDLPRFPPGADKLATVDTAASLPRAPAWWQAGHPDPPSMKKCEKQKVIQAIKAAFKAMKAVGWPRILMGLSEEGLLQRLLTPGVFISCTVINAAMWLLQRQLESEGIRDRKALSTNWAVDLQGIDTSPAACAAKVFAIAKLEGWKFMEQDVVVAPACNAQHFFLVVFKVSDRQVEVYDSLDGYFNEKYKGSLWTSIQALLAAVAPQPTPWTISWAPTPQQPLDSNDCAIFALTAAAHVLYKQPVSFTPEHVSANMRMRRLVLWHVLYKGYADDVQG